ncbi:hypothetical protein ATKI12_1165 [Kitasatospora sp. Ki12]
MSEREQERPTDQAQDQDRPQALEHRSQDQARRKEAAAKARLVFRDPLDQQSRDDTDAGWSEGSGAGGSGGRGLDWYLSQRPPHHGD